MEKNTLSHLVVIGTSAGGFNALKQIITTLPEDFPAPILVVQHMLACKNSLFTSLLSGYCALQIKFAENGDIPMPGTVYFAPPNYHLRVDKYGVLMLSNDAKVRYSRPSIDVLFESVSKLSRCATIAIILTGANSDGTQGAKAIQQAGGTIIVQAPESAEAITMPQSVIDAMDVDHIIWLDQIAPFLWDIYRQS